MLYLKCKTISAQEYSSSRTCTNKWTHYRADDEHDDIMNYIY